MRLLFAVLAAVFLASAPALAATPSPLPPIELRAPDQALGWIKAYRERPNPTAVPDLMKQLAALGAFQEPEGAGLYVGFMAGVIGANPKTAEKLAAAMATALPAADQWAAIKAIAYSRLAGWRHLLQATAPKLPTRKTMVDAYLTGKLPGFDHYRMPKDASAMEQAWRTMTFAKDDTVYLEPSPALLDTLWGYYFATGSRDAMTDIANLLAWSKDASAMEQAWRTMTFAKDDTVYLEPSPALLDTLWGYYFATGSREAMTDIANLVAWSKDGNDVGRLTIGSAAKYSIAANASRDQAILATVRDVRGRTDKEIVPILDEAIFAAETSETGALRQAAAAAIEELRTKGPSSRRNIAWWGQAGEGAISLGCVVAAVLGQVYLGVPCVVGGAVASATVRYLATPR